MNQSENKTALKIKYPDFSIDSEIDENLAKELQTITYDKLTTSSTTRTIKNIKKNIIATLKSNYPFVNGRVKEVADIILKKHGLHEDSFDFVNLFESGLHENINDISIDDNANKNEKVFRGYLNELEKSVDKLIGYDVLYRTMKDLYGEKEAKKLTGEMYTYALGLSDSSNISIPYSYYAHTPIFISINGQQELVSLKQLFEKFKDFVILESDHEWIDTNNIEVDYKPFNAKLGNCAKKIGKHINLLKEYPKTKIILKVWDTKNGWVDITRIVRHKNNVGFTLYQLDNGNFAFVTDNHPIYMANGTEKNAIDLSIGDRVLVDDDMSVPTGDANIIIPKKLAYFTGFLLGDGNVNSYDKEQFIYKPLHSPCHVKFIRGGNTVGIYQNDVDNSYIKKVAEDLFDNFETWRPSDKVERSIFFSSYEYAFICSTFFDFDFGENSFTKHLPNNILNWDNTSKEALLAGLIDSDGTIFNNQVNCVSIRMMSYSIIRGLYDVLKSLPGIHNVRTRIDGENISNCIYELVFSVTKESGLCSLSEKIKTQYSLNPKKYDVYHKECNSKKNIKNVVTKLIRFYSDEIPDTRFLKRELEYVYDITTSTGRFYANGMVQHNCWALDASKLVTVGREFGVLKSKPAKRVSSYISMLCETIHQMSNHLAGAIAIGSFFLDLAHLMIYKERRTLNELRTDKRIRKMIENEVQQFIHSINHLSRNGAESPFTNVSIFDRPKLEGLISDDNYGWYFPNHKAISTDNDLQDKMSNEDFKKYVIDYITEIQNLFMDFFEKGDPLQNGMPYRFPVATVNFSKVKNESTGKFEIQDKEFLKAVCKRDISRFNIFSSAGTKICSCCLSGDEIIEVSNSKQTLAEFIESYNVDKLANFEKDISNENLFVDSFNVESNKIEKDKILKVFKQPNDTGSLLKFTCEFGSNQVTPNHILIVKNKESGVISEVPAYKVKEEIQKYYIPVELADKTLTWDSILFVDTFKHSDSVYCIETENNHNFVANNIITHNCRLINDIEMLDFASQSNSLGGGGSISLGSHRVITINFQRIALECQSFEDYLNILSFRVEEAAKILKAHKLMLLKFTKEGYEPFIANGFINPKRLFSTFGLLGIYEANKTLRQKFDIPEDRDITGEILEYFNTKVNEVSKKYGIIGNIEQIPGESFAVRLAEADKAIYGFGDDYYKLYANQFCPLYEDFTLAEKIKTDGKYNALLTGGGIVHIQIATQTTPQQNEQLIKFACAEGCEHFALNRVYSRCKKCGKVYNTKVDKCDCGAEGDDLERLTRVIGFFTPVSSWGKVRREWEFPRRFFTDVSKIAM